ncbi:alpha/beta hydrolase family protein [Verrucomicrobiota bacterium]
MNRTPVDDPTFKQIAELFRYDRSVSLDAVTVGDWPHRIPYVIEKIRYRSVHNETVPGYFVCPKGAKGKRYPAVLLIHGTNSFWGKNEDWSLWWLDILARSGLCVLVIDNFGFGERKHGDEVSWLGMEPHALRDWVVQNVIDQRRGIDYLFTRAEVDTTKIGLFGGSMGGYIGTMVAGLEDRLSVVVLMVTRPWPYAPTDHPLLRYGHTLNFAPRITAPVMMVSATGDGIKTAEELFGLMPEPKRLVWYKSGHYIPPEKSNKEILEWLDLYLSPKGPKGHPSTIDN